MSCLMAVGEKIMGKRMPFGQKCYLCIFVFIIIYFHKILKINI